MAEQAPETGKEDTGNIRLLLDSREHSLQKLLGEFTSRTGIPMRVQSLDLGDIQIQVYRTDPETEVASWKTEYVIERKSASDLASSIADGRYREQKARLLSHYSPDQIMYLIEGYHSWQAKNGDLSRRTDAAISHTIIRDRIQIYHAANLQGTADLVWRLAADWLEFRDAERAAYRSTKGTLGSKRRDNNTPERVLRNMLGCVNGISAKTAQAIQEKYPTLGALVEAGDQIRELSVGGRKLPKPASEGLLRVIRGS